MKPVDMKNIQKINAAIELLHLMPQSEERDKAISLLREVLRSLLADI